MVSIYHPSGVLNKYVDCLVYSNYDPGYEIERLVPDGSINLIFELADHPQYIYNNENLEEKQIFKEVWISGMQLSYIAISAASKGLLVVRFNPIGIYPLFGIPAELLKNQVLDASIVLGNEVEEVRDQLINAKSSSHIFTIVVNWLVQKIKTASIPEKVVQAIVHQIQTGIESIKIRNCIEKSGYSHRHFSQLFKQFVGLTPKQYHRIARFNQVLSELQLKKQIDWSRLSYDLGYFDQAHFIKEFKIFSGLNPEGYLVEKGKYAHYIPLK